MARRRLSPLAGTRALRLEDRLAPAIVADLPTWLPAGPAPVAFSDSRVADAGPGSPTNATSGPLTDVAPDPVNPDLLFAASPNGGVWRTANGTAAAPTWTNLTDRLPSQSIASLDLDVATSGAPFRRLLAGTGATADVGRSGDRVGLFYTADALAGDAAGNLGQPLWQLFKGDTVATFSAPFTTTVISPTGQIIPTTSQVSVPVGFPQGAFVGTDITSVATRSFAGLGTGPATPTSYLLAATGRGVFRAFRLADGSVTPFAPLNGVGGLPAPAVQQSGGAFGFTSYAFTQALNPLGITDLTVDPQNPKRVYAAGQFGVFRTNDITAASPRWFDLTPQLTAAAGRAPTAPLVDANTQRVTVAVHGGLTGPGDPSVAYVAVANPNGPGLPGTVTVLWSDDQALFAGGAKVGSPFAGTFTLMDEPLTLSTPLNPVTDASTAKPIVLSLDNKARALTNGERVLVEDVRGNAGANGVFVVSNVSDTGVTLEGSAATGKYSGGGVAREVLTMYPGNTATATVHLSLAADPTDGNIVYIGGRFFERPTLDNLFGGNRASLFRGDRSRPFLAGAVTTQLLQNDTTFQWTQLVNDRAAYAVGDAKTATLVGSAPTPETRMMAFDANRNLIEVDDGGIFRRQNPRFSGRLDAQDPTESNALSANKWASVNGTLQVTELTGVGFDPVARAAYGASFDSGPARQLAGGTNLPPSAGGPGWVSDSGGPAVAQDYLSVPGRVSRYLGPTVADFDAANTPLTGRFTLNLGSAADAGFFKGLVQGDKDSSGSLIVAPNQSRAQVGGLAGPGANTILVGGVALYEDNNPADGVGQVVGDITPTGFTGRVTSMFYGGRQPGSNGVFVPTPRIAYVGSDSGQLFVRRATGGFVDVTAALDALSGGAPTGAAVRSVVADPEDWRVAFVLRTGQERLTATGPLVRRERVFRTTDGGVTFVDITAGLESLGTPDAAGNQTNVLDAQGNPINGLTTELFTLALFDGDPTRPGYVGVDNRDTFTDALLAGGRGGVFRFASLPDGSGGRRTPGWTEFGTALPNVPVNSLSVADYQYTITDKASPAFGQTRRGVGIAAGTLGRGAYVIPDAAALASDGATPLALAASTVTLNGVRGDGTTGPLAGGIVADINNPAFVTVSDGTSIATFERSTIQGFTFKGSAAQPDSVLLTAGPQAGGDLNFVRFPITVDLGNTRGDSLTVLNGSKATNTVVTFSTQAVANAQVGGLPVVVQTVGAGPTDNLFNTALGGSLRIRGLDQGVFTLDLGAASAVANQVFVQGTKAGVTRVIGGVGADPVTPTRGDTFLVNSNAGFIQVPILNPTTGKQATNPITGAPLFNTVPGDVSGTLDKIQGDLEILGPAAAVGSNKYFLQLSDRGGVSGNNGVILGRDAAAGLGTVLNLGGPTGTSAIRYNAAVGDLNVLGSDSPTVSEAYTVADPLARLTVDTGDGPDVLNVQSLTRVAGLFTGAGDDLIRVGSRAGVNDDGDLSRITVPLTVDAGAGDNRLFVSNAGSPVSSTVAISRDQIAGASAGPITYLATGGRYFDGTGNRNGVLFWGSNQAADQITVASALKGSQITVDGRGGPDSITVLGDDLEGAGVRVFGGGGGDQVTVTQGLFGLIAASLEVVGTGTDTLTVQGYDNQFRTDQATVRLDGAGRGSAVVDGDVTDVRFSGQGRVVFDGLAGRNNLNLVDNTGTAYGSPSNPGAGIVFAPLGAAAGEVRLGGGRVAPLVSFANVNGSDADGLVITGDSAGNAQFADTLTVVGPSETGLGGTGPLAGLESQTADSTITVSDQQVVFERTSAGTGQLRSVALGRVNGRSTISNLVVLAGNQSKAGDKVTVTPSREINILVDGQGPSRSGTAGNVLTIATDQTYNLTSTSNASLGGPQVRVETADGASFGYRGFGRLVGGSGGGRGIYAVGADVGGGPRVRVYDAVTNDVLFDQFVYEPTFTGGVRVATGDVTGDGVPDLVVAAGPGGGPRVSVYDGVTFKVVSSFFAYEQSFRGGLYLAVGDLDGNGFSEIVTGTGVGGGPLVKAFDAAGKLLTSVFAFESTFRGGVRVAVGDITGDGKADLICTAGPGGGPVVRVFDPTSLKVVSEYFAADPGLRTGLSVAAGDLTGDGLAEIIVAPASGPVSEATVRRGDGTTVAVPLFQDQAPDATPAPSAGALSDTGGARLATADADADGNVKVLLAARGPGFPSKVYRYFIDPVQEAGSTQAFEDEFVGGVWVG